MDQPTVIALASRSTGTLFVRSGYRDGAAHGFGVDDAHAADWTICPRGAGAEEPRDETLTVVESDLDLVGFEPRLGDERILLRAKCSGNVPAQDVDCEKVSDDIWLRRKLVGYSTCERSEGATDTCRESYVEVGTVTVYGDATCQVLRSRHRQARWVCLP